MHPFEDIEVPSGSVGIHWFGQSTFALKDAAGTIVQVDPYYPRERPAELFIHQRPPLHEGSLRTDYILLTHNHGDHTCLESVLRICEAYPQVCIVGPVESVAALQQAGIGGPRITSTSAGDTTTLDSMTACSVWAKPPHGVEVDDIPAPDVQHLGYVITAGRVRVYISGDPINTFAEHEELLSPIRDLCPDIGLLTTHPTEGEFPFFEGSSSMAQSVGLKAAIPSHYGCFVKRDYDPRQWAAHLFRVEPLIIPYNQSVVFSI